MQGDSDTNSDPETPQNIETSHTPQLPTVPDYPFDFPDVLLNLSADACGPIKY
jgi:hypothetical protein